MKGKLYFIAGGMSFLSGVCICGCRGVWNGICPQAGRHFVGGFAGELQGNCGGFVGYLWRELLSNCGVM